MATLTKRVASLSPEKQRLFTLLLKEKSKGLSRLPLLAQGRETNVFPLSFAQQRLWFLDQLDPGSPAYLMSATVRFTGPLDIKLLKLSLDEVVRRHEALRTSFATVDEQPVQVIAPPRPVDVPVVDLAGLSEPERWAEVRRMAEEEGKTPFDLERGPLLRASLLRLSEQEHVALFTVHHISSDGWSMDVLNREVTTIYEAYKLGQPSPLPELTIQYADFAVWQRQWLQGEVLDKQLNYWKKQLAGAPPLIELPTDRPRPAMQTYRGLVYGVRVSPTVVKGLRDLCRQEGVTLFMTMLAAFKVLLSRYSGQDDIVVGTPISGRTRGETEELIGFFVNSLVLRTEVPDWLTFRQLLKRVREVALGAYAHQDLPFEKLVEELQRERHLSYNPLFQVLFNLQNAQKSQELTGVKTDSSGSKSVTSKFDLTMDVAETGESLIVEMEYNTDLFNEGTIKRMAGHYLRILEAVALDAGQLVCELPLLSEDERHQQLEEWNDTSVTYAGEQTLHELFETQAATTPEAIALVHEDEQMSYRELNERSNQLAHYLQELGVGPDSLVALCCERSLELVVAMLGVLKTGGAYLPLDLRYPHERLAFMMADAEISLLLTQTHLAAAGVGQWAGEHTRVIELDREWEAISQRSVKNPAVCTTADNLAYMIYTSGSTGKPKGVAIEHASAAAFIHWAGEVFDQRDLRAVLFSTSVCFDLSIYELFVTLSHGGEVILANNALHLPQLSHANEVTLINTVPSAMAELLRMKAVPDSVRVVNLAGEPLSEELVEEIYASTRVEKVYNLYGPSEDTTYSTYTLAHRGEHVTIGRPIANTCVYVLDGHLQPVPVGVAGDLYIGGSGLARGYWRRPELTAEKFIPDAFSSEAGTRLYRTGDKVRYLENGNLEFLGRADHQVKLRGFRIELGEIETVLRTHEQVREALVQVRDLESGRQLVAYVVPNTEEDPVRQLRSYLRERLPDYMAPAVFVTLKEMPLTPNGKVDRRALPAPDTEGLVEREYVAPRDALEMELTKIWQNVLGLKTIGIRDDFFEMGGHSMLAVRVFGQIGRLIDVDLPLPILFEAPTIERLAAVVRKRSGIVRVAGSSLVELQGEGSQRPLFFVHPGSGNIFCYIELSRLLGKDQPVYAFQSRVLENGAAWPSIEQMAAHYIKLLRGVQAEGPYCLSGLSLGGVVAFEMSRQLEKAGQKVSLLAIIDTPAPGVMKVLPPDDLLLMVDFAEVMGVLPSISLSQEQALQMSVRERLAYVLEQVQREGAMPPEITLATIERLWEVFQKNLRALMAYGGGNYGGTATLFKTADSAVVYSDQGDAMAWQGFITGGVQVEELPGTHHTIVKKPHVGALASRLRAHLREAQRDELLVKGTL